MTAKIDRASVLDGARTLKMARSAHAYVRGNTVKFYEWLSSSPAAAKLPEGPPIWICGDCHLGNLGPLSDGHGRVEMQIRDLDQTVIGNPALDIIRLGLSLASAARGSDLPGVTTALMVESMVDGYEQALGHPDDGIEDAGPEPDAVRTVRRHALGRRWRHLARERIRDIEPAIPLGKKFWAIEDDERAALRNVFADPRLASTVLSLEEGEQDVTTRLVDAAYWMKGCSSLGLLRYAALIAIKGASKREKYALIDLKEAVAPVAPVADPASMPSDPALRVVTGARALSPNLGDRMAATTMFDRSLFVRELMPQDLKLEVEQFSRSEAVRAARYLAWVVGHAHARQMDAVTRSRWRGALLEHRGADIAAPSWLWKSVVDLSGTHEAAYLEHCRAYALAGNAEQTAG
ncbi:DUF2252 family protein [Sphingomonas abietis]|uniref:DUF2252 family protein n=1 Tax=Sphingomonas abietis TaxID=3012344 RepID=A0ABY7NTH9_9SPHN|nr:DUF2252 family protein [Sphingomonas abietis]WBO24452.1 DUF2252 family protein [Sphingomonas abietis]